MQQETDDPENALVLAYVPADRRPAFDAIMALDRSLADIVRTTTQPAIGQIRLAWWYEQLANLAREQAPAMPVLADVAKHVVPVIGAAALPDLVAGWDVLIEAEELDDEAMMRHASERGGRLFVLAARLLGDTNDPGRVDNAGQGWALADLAAHLQDNAAAARAADLARDRLRGSLPRRRSRALGLMALRARLDFSGVAPGSPRRAARLAWYGLTAR